MMIHWFLNIKDHMIQPIAILYDSWSDYLPQERGDAFAHEVVVHGQHAHDVTICSYHAAIA